MFATNISSSADTSSVTGRHCNHASNQQAPTDDTNRFAQLMSENNAGVQGNRPPPPPPPQTSESSDTDTDDTSTDSLQTQGNRPPPPPPPQGIEGAEGANGMQAQEGQRPPPPPPPGEDASNTGFSNTEDASSIISQFLASLQSADLSSLSGSNDTSNLLSGAFNDYFNQSYNNGSFS